jgi:His/Glu/Gln/Arg/opine family amino acid ABC transporter permease subunit
MFLYVYDWSVVLGSWRFLAMGLLATLQLTAISAAIAAVVGLVIAVLRLSPIRALQVLAFTYVQVFRSLSLYIYVLWLYFGLSLVAGIDMSPTLAAIISLSFLYSAYMAEVYRSAIQAIELGQWEAARSLGLSTRQTFMAIILPQSLRIAVPPLVNNLVAILQDSSIVSYVGVTDLMYAGEQMASYYRAPVEMYTTVAAIYLVVVLVISGAIRPIERLLSRHLS